MPSSALSEMMDRINTRLRAIMMSRGYGDHLQENLRVVGKAFGALRQSQSRIEATTYEQAWHHPFPESLVAPTGFALEGLRYAKRVYEKAATRRASDAGQELHNAERPAAPQR